MSKPTHRQYDGRRPPSVPLGNSPSFLRIIKNIWKSLESCRRSSGDKMKEKVLRCNVSPDPLYLFGPVMSCGFRDFQNVPAATLTFLSWISSSSCQTSLSASHCSDIWHSRLTETKTCASARSRDHVTDVISQNKISRFML